MGAGGDPYASVRSPAPAQRRRLFLQTGRQGKVELDIARDTQRVRPRAQLSESSGLGLCLRGDQLRAAQCAADQAGDSLIAPRGFRRQARIDDQHRNITTMTDMKQVRP